MTVPLSRGTVLHPAVKRLAALAELDQVAHAALGERIVKPLLAKRGRSIVHEGKPIGDPLIMLSGWAARVRIFEDGRLQILSFLLPGDLIGNCAHPRPLSVSTVTALTDFTYCLAPSPLLSPALAEAYAVSSALEESYLLGNIARLGRFTAEERLADLLLELAERLTLCGLVNGGQFEMPLTQQILADATGLTVVHVNRMISQMRRQNDIAWNERTMTLINAGALSRKVGRQATRVQARHDFTG